MERAGINCNREVTNDNIRYSWRTQRLHNIEGGTGYLLDVIYSFKEEQRLEKVFNDDFVFDPEKNGIVTKTATSDDPWHAGRESSGTTYIA